MTENQLTDWQKTQLRAQEWLAGLKTGDHVCIRAGFRNTPSILAVTHTTPTQIHVGSTKFRRKDGHRIGESYYSASIQEVTQEIVEERKENKLRAEFHDRVKYTLAKWQSLPLEQIEKILAVLPETPKEVL